LSTSPVWASSPSPSPPRSPRRNRKKEEKEKEKQEEKEKERDREKQKEREKEEEDTRERYRENRDQDNMRTNGARVHEEKEKDNEHKKEKDLDAGKSKKLKGSKKKHKKHSSSSSESESDSHSSSSSSSDSDSKKRNHKKKKKSKEGKKKSKKKDEIELDLDDPSIAALWTEKKPNQELSDQAIGPRPLPVVQQTLNYGGQMLPGEAEAIAQFVQQNKRIPRRGEVGLTSDEIEHFEDVGFVMSGSRHKRMNAIRMRKENQVYSAEEKRALAMFNYEEKAKRENTILAEFRDMLSTKMGDMVKKVPSPQ